MLPTRILITACGNLCELKWRLPFPAARASPVLFGVGPQDVRSAQGGSPSGPGGHNPGGSVTGPWGSEGGVQIPGSRIWRGRPAAHNGGLCTWQLRRRQESQLPGQDGCWARHPGICQGQVAGESLWGARRPWSEPGTQPSVPWESDQAGPRAGRVCAATWAAFLPTLVLQALHEEMTAETPPPQFTPRVPSLQAACVCV